MKNIEAINNYYQDNAKVSADGRSFEYLRGSLARSEAIELSAIVKRFQSKAAVEVGTGFGASAVAISSSMKDEGGGSLWTLDPFQDQFGNIGVAELQRLGLSANAAFRASYAEDFFQAARAEGAQFDLIFHDGAHSVGPKMTHVFLAIDLLVPGGVFVLHDAFKPCTAACVTYLVKERQFALVDLKPDNVAKRLLRSIKYAVKYGPWFGFSVVPSTHVNLVALRKPLTV